MPTTQNAGAGVVSSATTFDLERDALPGDIVTIRTSRSYWYFVRTSGSTYDPAWVSGVSVMTTSGVGAPAFSPHGLKVQRQITLGGTVEMTGKTTGSVRHLYLNGVRIF